jgi:hypothetical protein
VIVGWLVISGCGVSKTGAAGGVVSSVTLPSPRVACAPAASRARTPNACTPSTARLIPCRNASPDASPEIWLSTAPSTTNVTVNGPAVPVTCPATWATRPFVRLPAAGERVRAPNDGPVA